MEVGDFYECPNTMWLDVGNRREIEVRTGEIIMVVCDGVWSGALFYDCNPDVRSWKLVGRGSRNDYLTRINTVTVTKEISGDEPTTQTGFDLMVNHGVSFRRHR